MPFFTPCPSCSLERKCDGRSTNTILVSEEEDHIAGFMEMKAGKSLGPDE